MLDIYYQIWFNRQAHKNESEKPRNKGESF